MPRSREMDLVVLCECALHQNTLVLTFSSYFATYEILKTYLSKPLLSKTTDGPAEAQPLSLGAVVLAGGSAGVAMWSLAIPPDVGPFRKYGQPADNIADNQVSSSVGPSRYILRFP